MAAYLLIGLVVAMMVTGWRYATDYQKIVLKPVENRYSIYSGEQVLRNEQNGFHGQSIVFALTFVVAWAFILPTFGFYLLFKRFRKEV